MFRQSWPKLVLILLAVVAAGLGNVALLSIVAKAVSKQTFETSLVYAFFLICVATLVCRAGAEIGLLRLTQGHTLRLRVRISRKILSTPYRTLQGIGRSELFVILTRDIETCIQVFGALPGMFCNGIIILGCLGYLAWLSLPVLAIFVGVISLGIVGFQIAKRYPEEQMNVVRERIGTLYDHLRNLIDGSRELLMNLDRGTMYVDKVVTGAAEDFRSRFVSAMTAYSWISNVSTTLFYVLIGLLALALPLWIPQQAETMTASTLVVLYIMRPITDIISTLPILQQGAISLERIQRLDANLEPVGPQQPAHPPFPSVPDWRIELKDVSLNHADVIGGRQFTLGPVDMGIARGEIVFLVGDNGSGKTTLALVLTGLYEEDSGAILFNGVQITNANRAAYRQQFSAIMADFHLFRELIWTEDRVLNERAGEYLRVMGLDEKVKIIDGNFSTLDLSTGQRKRLALVAAFLEDRPIYLFDEWAADQDPGFKHLFYTLILPDLKSQGKTVVAISHDDSYFDLADRVIRLENGRVHECVAQSDKRFAVLQA